MVKVKSLGNFKKTAHNLRKFNKAIDVNKLKRYGEAGVEALKNATPEDTGKTKESWDYVVQKGKGQISIVWTNSNKNEGVPIAILIQYGHATQSGYYIQGKDFINPAMRPVFQSIAEKIIEEVRR